MFIQQPCLRCAENLQMLAILNILVTTFSLTAAVVADWLIVTPPTAFSGHLMYFS